MDKIFGLLGRKLGHSYSPEIHSQLGNPAYRLIELEPRELEAFLHRDNIGGLNVTIPYKLAVIPYLADLTEEARAIGSVNTIAWKNGKLTGHNTDCAGFRFMADLAGISFAGEKVLVFGSGGASLTAKYAAETGGAAQVVTISRSGPDNYDNLDRHKDAGILINATPLGMYPNTGVSPVDISRFPACKGVLDVVYNPLRTAFLAQAEELGIPHGGGLPMLVSQAAAAHEFFFDTTVEASKTTEILEYICRQVENIILVGMPGCGKTTVGATLAQLTGRQALDMDQEIEKEAGTTISDIFAKDGEEAFRSLERNMAAKLGAEKGLIIMTGGGAVKDHSNYLRLHQNGRIYFLQRDLSLLSREGRPLSQGADLEEMYRQRLEHYRFFADAEISNHGTPQQAAEAIWSDFNENSCY